MSLFVNFLVKSVHLEQPLQYPSSALSLANLRKGINNPVLKQKLQHRCLALNLNPQYIDVANVSDYVAKTNNIGVENDIQDPVETQWIFATTFIIFMLELDDHFDTPCCSLDNISKLSTEKRAPPSPKQARSKWPGWRPGRLAC